MKISFIGTVYNEEPTIIKFLDSLYEQSVLPDEIVIVDGGSTDETVKRIKNYQLRIKQKKVPFSLFIKKGNRSVGRNEAVKQSSREIIVCSDAGNILDRNWVKHITQPFEDKAIDVVAGYYKGKSENTFQKCLIPFVLVMLDKVDPSNFLPATRSMAFRKSIWKKVGGFNEQLSHNEDYAFAHQLKKVDAQMVFAPKAIVYWLPRTTLKQTFVMFFRFALGDIEAGIYRPKVILLFARYIVGLSLLGLFTALTYNPGLIFLAICGVGYIAWSIQKNYRYVHKIGACVFLPILQFTSDIAVISGSTIGLSKRIYFRLLSRNLE